MYGTHVYDNRLKDLCRREGGYVCVLISKSLELKSMFWSNNVNIYEENNRPLALSSNNHFVPTKWVMVDKIVRITHINVTDTKDNF